MKRTWLIGDVHGCAKQLDMLLRRIKFDEHKDQLLFAGDLINRGPDSLEVVRLVRSLEKKHNTVLGNHDSELFGSGRGRQAAEFAVPRPSRCQRW